MSDFARYCPKCYQFFRDLDLYTKHVETCGFAKKTADSRPQTAAEEKKDRKRQTSAEAKTDGKQQTTDSDTENVDNPPASAAATAEGDTPSAVPSPHVKSPKFKT